MIALDTNVLIYAYDGAEPKRQQTAVDLISAVQDAVLLWQVACEFIAASRKLLDEAGDDLFTFVRFPNTQWKALRTTSALERLNEEFRRRR